MTELESAEFVEVVEVCARAIALSAGPDDLPRLVEKLAMRAVALFDGGKPSDSATGTVVEAIFARADELRAGFTFTPRPTAALLH